jgi:hypothetical protein
MAGPGVAPGTRPGTLRNPAANPAPPVTPASSAPLTEGASKIMGGLLWCYAQ